MFRDVVRYTTDEGLETVHSLITHNEANHAFYPQRSAGSWLRCP